MQKATKAILVRALVPNPRTGFTCSGNINLVLHFCPNSRKTVAWCVKWKLSASNKNTTIVLKVGEKRTYVWWSLLLCNFVCIILSLSSCRDTFSCCSCCCTCGDYCGYNHNDRNHYYKYCIVAKTWVILGALAPSSSWWSSCHLFVQDLSLTVTHMNSSLCAIYNATTQTIL